MDLRKRDVLEYLVPTETFRYVRWCGNDDEVLYVRRDRVVCQGRFSALEGGKHESADSP